jgi:hypothetical protein
MHRQHAVHSAPPGYDRLVCDVPTEHTAAVRRLLALYALENSIDIISIERDPAVLVAPGESKESAESEIPDLFSWVVDPETGSQVAAITPTDISRYAQTFFNDEPYKRRMASSVISGAFTYWKGRNTDGSPDYFVFGQTKSRWGEQGRVVTGIRISHIMQLADELRSGDVTWARVGQATLEFFTEYCDNILKRYDIPFSE